MHKQVEALCNRKPLWLRKRIQSVHWIVGSPTNHSDLARVRASHAQAVIVLPAHIGAKKPAQFNQKTARETMVVVDTNSILTTNVVATHSADRHVWTVTQLLSEETQGC